MDTLGIDPGLRGAMILLSEDEEIIGRWPMPVIGNKLDLHGVDRVIREVKRLSPRVKVYMELVSARPGQGVVSVFTFGAVSAAVEMACVCHDLPLVKVTPVKWQTVMHAGVPKTLEPKERSLMAVKRLFPTEDLRASQRCKVFHLGLVDALLMAAYGIADLRGEVKHGAGSSRRTTASG